MAASGNLDHPTTLPARSAREGTVDAAAPDAPLRVALVTGVYDYIKDGISLTLNRLVDYLESQGIEVLVFAPTAKEPAFEHSGTLISTPSIPMPFRPEYRLSLGLPRSTRRRLSDFRPTLVHIAAADILGYQALRLARSLSIPVVASYHTRYDLYLKHYGADFLKKPGLAYLRHFYSQCEHLYVPSESMAAELRDEYQGTDIRPWSRGVDIARFHPSKRSEKWRKSIGVRNNEVLVTFVSRLVLEKGLETLSNILQGLKAKGVPHRSMIVGDGPERANLENLLPDSIFTGFLHGDELARAYASSDIFLFPSTTETFGSVTLEAMASGLPAVCADATGSRSIVVDGVTGFLAKPGSEAEFIAYVEKLICGPELCSRMAQAGLERSRNYSWDTAMQQLVSHYHDALTSAKISN